jgi:hypothetical protein
LAAVPVGVAVIAVLFVFIQMRSGTHTNTTEEFLSSVHTAYAAEAEQNKDRIRYIKMRITDEKGIQRTEEHWDTGDKKTDRTTDSEGTVTSKVVTLQQRDTNKQTIYTSHPEQMPTGPGLSLGVDTAISLVTFATPPESDPQNTTDEVDIDDQLTCIVSQEDMPELSEQEDPHVVLEKAIAQEDAAAVQEVIQKLLAEKRIEDRGEENGLRTFAIHSLQMHVAQNADGSAGPTPEAYDNSTEFYTFDAQTFKVKKFSAYTGDTLTYSHEYLFDGYVDPTEVPSDVLSTEGLHELGEVIAFPHIEETGCYNVNGQKVGEMNIEVIENPDGSSQVNFMPSIPSSGGATETIPAASVSVGAAPLPEPQILIEDQE